MTRYRVYVKRFHVPGTLLTGQASALSVGIFRRCGRLMFSRWCAFPVKIDLESCRPSPYWLSIGMPGARRRQDGAEKFDAASSRAMLSKALLCLNSLIRQFECKRLLWGGRGGLRRRQQGDLQSWSFSTVPWRLRSPTWLLSRSADPGRGPILNAPLFLSPEDMLTVYFLNNTLTMQRLTHPWYPVPAESWPSES